MQRAGIFCLAVCKLTLRLMYNLLVFAVFFRVLACFPYLEAEVANS
jgi:hypothetical protein